MSDAVVAPPDSTWTRIGYWLFFVFLVAAAPLAIGAAIGYLHNKTPTVQELFSEGDAFLLAIALTADAISRVVKKKSQKGSTVLLGACSLVLLGAAVFFSSVKTDLTAHKIRVEQAVQEGGTAPPEQRLAKLVDVVTAPSVDNESGLERLSLLSLAVGLSVSFIVVVWE